MDVTESRLGRWPSVESHPSLRLPVAGGCSAAIIGMRLLAQVELLFQNSILDGGRGRGYPARFGMVR